MRLAREVAYGDALRQAPLRELMAEAALAHARLADDPDHVPLSGERLLERPQLLVAPYEAREAARAGHVESPAGRADAGQLVDVHDAGGALHLELAEVAECEMAVHQRRGVLSQIDPVGRGQLLHPLRQTHGVTDRGVSHREVLADRSDHHL